jgi:hypothetical protein
MRRLLLILILSLLSVNLRAQLGPPAFPIATPANPSLTNTMFPYVATSANCPWVRAHSDLASGSSVSCSGAGNSVFTNYVDWLDYITWWYKAGADYCDANGVGNCFANLFLLVNRDYYNPRAPTFGDLFDFAESTTTGNLSLNFQLVHGAFRYRSGAYTDVTCGSYGGISCGTQPVAPIALLSGDYYYLGFMQPYDVINFVLTMPASGATVTWEYSTGSGGWSSLTVTDGTSNLSASGQVTFTAPDDSGTPWKRDIVSGSKSKYWTRLHITGSGVIFTSVKGQWTGNSPCTDCGAGNNANIRGWSQSAWAVGPVLTVDGIPYNPTPPSICPGGANVCATAHFPYQSAYSTNLNSFVPNPDTFNGTITAANNIHAQQLAFKDSISGVIGLGYNGVMQDNVLGIFSNIVRPAFNTLIGNMNFHSGASSTLAGVEGDEGSGNVYGYLPALKSAATQIHASQTTGFVIGWNNSGTSLNGQTGDVYYNEFCSNQVYHNGSVPWQWYDDTLSSSNTLGSVGYCQNIDPTKYGNLYDGIAWHIFDSDRGVLDAVGMFYMGNAWHFTGSVYDYNYTGYLWDTSASALYSTTDEVGAYQSSSTLLYPITADSSGNPVTIILVNGSGVLPVGGPYFASAIQGRLCPTPTTCNNGDKVALTRTGSNTFVTYNVAGGSVPPILHSYSAGSTFQFATTFALHSIGTPPLWSNVGAWWALWQPIFGVDVGKPDPSGYNAGVRSCGPACATTALPSPPAVFKTGASITAIGHAGVNGAPAGAPASCTHGTAFGDVYRRDFVNTAGQHNIVLLRAYVYGACTDDFDWASQNIVMSNARGDCAPSCSYQSVHSDGTLDVATSTYNMPAGSALLLMQAGSGPPPVNSPTLLNGVLLQGTAVH